MALIGLIAGFLIGLVVSHRSETRAAAIPQSTRHVGRRSGGSQARTRPFRRSASRRTSGASCGWRLDPMRSRVLASPLARQPVVPAADRQPAHALQHRVVARSRLGGASLRVAASPGRSRRAGRAAELRARCRTGAISRWGRPANIRATPCNLAARLCATRSSISWLAISVASGYPKTPATFAGACGSAAKR
jgi:hypothetical protein